jgi:hypothetical protein
MICPWSQGLRIRELQTKALQAQRATA